MTWVEFPYAAFLAMAFWAVGAVAKLTSSGKSSLSVAGKLLLWSGTAVMVAFLILYWITIDRPPLRTLGETRLWYATLIPLVGIVVEYRWKIRWMNYYCVALASLFLSINLIFPEVYDKSLMPALQSVWFVPHVVVYLVGYVLLAASSAAAVHALLLFRKKKGPSDASMTSHYLAMLGFVFLTFGLVFGALWAKEAWGHYWTWDPKETWALIAWLIYLGYLHANALAGGRSRSLQWYLALSFIVLLVSWFGVNYLPSAQNSVHSYQS